MKVDLYGMQFRDGRLEPDMEHELAREAAVHQALTGQPVVVKIWVCTAGAVDLAAALERLPGALAPLGLR